MSLFSDLINKYNRATPKQLVLSGVFMLALAGAIGGGFASRQMSSAAVARSTDAVNSIDNKNACGGIGAVSASELICDIPSRTDLKGIYDHFGLQTTDYTRFKSTARFGTAKTNGDVIVDGQKVMTSAWSIGRTAFSYSTSYPISGVGTYRKSMHTSVLKQDLPVMVMFDNNGTAEFAVLNACGNPVGGNRVKSGGECKQLIKTPVEGEKNTYNFTTQASVFGLAKIVKYDYYVKNSQGEKLVKTTTSGSTAVKLTFTEASTVTVKVTISLPGGKTKVLTSTLCSKEVGVVKEEFLFKCEALVKTAVDDNTFRFNAVAKKSDNVTVKSVDFTLDNSVTAKGVITDSDNDGNIDRTYTFNDFNEHTVKAVINFLVDGETKQSTEVCKAKVQREEKKCVPKENEDENCKPKCIPTEGQDEDCKELPKTGPAGAAGLFVGVSAAGAVAHRLFMNRRRSE